MVAVSFAIAVMPAIDWKIPMIISMAAAKNAKAVAVALGLSSDIVLLRCRCCVLIARRSRPAARPARQLLADLRRGRCRRRHGCALAGTTRSQGQPRGSARR